MKKTKISCKTGETVYSITSYYNTNHWKILKQQYMESELSKLCYKCRNSNIPYNFHHRTKIRLGNERLNDIMPICCCCKNIANPSSSKKKTERRQLSPLGFRCTSLSDGQKNWLLSMRPTLRGVILSKYYSNKASQYNPSSRWINTQVKLTSKWIKKQKKELIGND